MSTAELRNELARRWAKLRNHGPDERCIVDPPCDLCKARAKENPSGQH